MSSAQQEEEVLGKAYDGRLMGRLLAYVRPYRWQVVVATLAAGLHSVTQVVGPYLNKVIIDRYLFPTHAPGSHSLIGNYLPADPWRGIASVALLYITMLVIGFALDFLQTWSMQWVGQHSMYDLRRDLFHHLQRLQISFFDRNPVGRMVTRVTNDVEMINDMISSALVAFFDDSFVLLLIIVVMFRFNWKLSLITLAVLPFMILATRAFRRAVRDSYRRIRVAVARINVFLQEHVTGMSVVQAFNREQRAYDEFDQINRVHLRAWTDAVFAYALYYPAIEFLSTLAIALILWFGGLRVLNHT
ncbi:MAG: ABC transporter ATP-binding protein, partial [Rhizobiaceae bacterium]